MQLALRKENTDLSALFNNTIFKLILKNRTHLQYTVINTILRAGHVA